MAGYGFGGQHTPAPKRKPKRRKAPPRSVAQSVIGASRGVTRGTKAPVRRVTRTAKTRANVAPTPPGPITNRDQKRIVKHKKTKQYKKAVKSARKSRERAEKRVLLKHLREAFDAPTRRDAIGYDPGLAKQPLSQLERNLDSRRPLRETGATRDVLGGGELARWERKKEEAKEKVFKAAAEMPDDPRAPRFPLKKHYTKKERDTIARRTEKFVREVADPKGLKGKDPGKKAYRIAKRRTPEAAVEFAAYEQAKSDPHDQTVRLASRQGSAHEKRKKKGKNVSVAGVSLNVSPSTALDLLLRPLYASAGAAEALREGKPGDVPSRAYKGIRGKEKLTYSDVLKHGGAPASVATVGGLAADIFLTPDTYATGGTTIPAKVAAKTARAATKAKYAKAVGVAESRIQREVAHRIARKGAQGNARRAAAIERDVRARMAARPGEFRATAGRSTAKTSKSGKTRDVEATGVAERAARKAYEKNPAKNRGLTAGFGKKTVRHADGSRTKVRRASSGRATAAVGRKLGSSAAGKLVRESGPYQAFGKAFHAGFRPAGRAEKAHDTVRRSELQIRHELDSRLALADQRTRVYEKALGDKEGPALFVNDALEGYTSKRIARQYLKRPDVPAPTRTRLERFVADDSRDFTKFRKQDLPDDLRNVAVNLEEDFKYMRRVRRESGAGGRGLVVEGKGLDAKGVPQEAKGYVAHVRRQDLDQIEGTSRKMRKRRGAGPGSAKEDVRQIRAPLAVLREQSPHLFDERTGILYAASAQKAEKQAAAARHNYAIASTGRPLRADSKIDFGEEAIYHVGGRGKIRKLERDDKIAKAEIERAFTTAEQRIAFKKRAAILRGKASRTGNPAEAKKLRDEAERLTELAKPPEPGRYIIANKNVVDDAIDRSVTRAPEDLVGGWNRVMGLWKKAVTLPMPSYHMRNLYGDAWNAHLESSVSELFRALGNNKGLLKEYAQFKKSRVSLDRAARAGTLSPEVAFMLRAERLGVIGAGFSRDVIEQLGRRTPGRLERASQWRENLMRLASYRAAVKRGVPEADAAKVVKRLHFDYGDLTDFERSVRAVIPFYTFAAKNTALQASKLVTRPGKYANFEKVRVEGMKAAGLPEDWQERVPSYVKLQLGIPAFGVTSDGLPMLALPGLPITDLNRLDPEQAAGMLLQSLGPWRAIFESYLNTSVYFRDKIDRGRPVPAPDWVGSLPEPIRNMLQIERSDKPNAKTGESGYWVWPAKTDFMVKQLPELNFLLQITTGQKNRRGQGAAEKLISLSGVRPQPYDEAQNTINKLFNDREDVQNQLDQLPPLDRIGKLKDRSPEDKARLRRERKQLNKKMRRIDQRLHRTSKGAGYVFPYGAKPPAAPTLQEQMDAALGGAKDPVQRQLDRALDPGSDPVQKQLDAALGR